MITGCAEFQANSQERHERVAEMDQGLANQPRNPHKVPANPVQQDEKYTVDYLNSLVGNR